MADSSLMPALIGLGGTVIGFAGGLVTQLILEGRRQKAERLKRRAEKLEELVSVLLEYATMNINDVEYDDFKKHWFLLHSKINAIMTVYFPQFRTRYNSLANIGIVNDEEWKVYIKMAQELITEIGNYAKREFQ